MSLDSTPLVMALSPERIRSSASAFQLNDVPLNMPSDRLVLGLLTTSGVSSIFATEEDCNESALELGAWARYPAYTQVDRRYPVQMSHSAGHNIR